MLKELVQIYLGAKEVEGERADWWGLVREEDMESMEPIKEQPEKCVYCGGHMIHSYMCNIQRKGWSVLPWGKHKGRHVSEVPTSYLDFCLSNDYGNVDVKEMFLKELQRRDGKYRTAAWEEKAKSTRWDKNE